MKQFTLTKSAVIALAIMLSFATVVPVFAETDIDLGVNMKGEDRGIVGKPVLVGTVTSVSGSTITVLGHAGLGLKTATTTFTVNGANAKVVGNDKDTLSDISVGDSVLIQGTINGSLVTATIIHDGVFKAGRGQDKDKKENDDRKSEIIPTMMQGNGRPVIAGSVTAVSSTSLTITNKSNIQYTIDASSSKIFAQNATSSLSSIALGDSVVVQGSINGNTVVASTIIVQEKNSIRETPRGKATVFGRIGQFFMHFFGF